MQAPPPPAHLSFQDQLVLLKSRGLTVGDEPLALSHLERVGYYRLMAYLVPLRQTRTITGPDGKSATELLEEFKPTTEFRHAVELYVFDKKLRLLMLDVIERIEVAFRVDFAHTLGRRGAWAHRDIAKLDPFLQQKPARHINWLDRADELEGRSQTDWVEKARRHGPLPIWMAVETWDFGTLAGLSEIAHRVDRTQIAAKYGIPNAKMLSSWLRSLGYVRNLCAHHDRLWNSALVIQPMFPRRGEIPMLNELDRFTPAQTRVYASVAVAQYLLKTIAPSSAWTARMIELWDSFPVIPGVNAMQAGFMPSWRTWPLWR